jgi:hypothetical protein
MIRTLGGNAKRLPILCGDILGFTVVALVVCLAASTSAFGQWMGKQTGCYADSIAANPNRPTVTNPAHVTQYGVLELEYGWDRFWPEEGIHQTSIGGLLKFGMLCDIELRWNTLHFFLRLTQEVHTKLSETIGLVRRSEFTGRRDDCQRWPSLIPSKYPRPVPKMDWARGAWITHSPSWRARPSRTSISISVSPNS